MKSGTVMLFFSTMLLRFTEPRVITTVSSLDLPHVENEHLGTADFRAPLGFCAGNRNCHKPYAAGRWDDKRRKPEPTWQESTWAGLLTLAPDCSFLLLCTPESSCGGTSGWVPATLRRDQTEFLPGIQPGCWGLWGMNQQMGALSLSCLVSFSLYVCFPLCLSNK